MSAQKLERLLNLTAALLDTRRPLTVEEIGRLIPGYPDDPASFRRTFERDKDDLREMGISVDVVYPNGTDNSRAGYLIDPMRYYLPDPGLEPDELAALRLAVGAIRVEGSSEGDAFRKLGGLPGSEQGDDDSTTVLADVPTPPELIALFAATIEHRVVTFAYHDSPREVEPHRLDFQRGRWYLTAFDRGRVDRRSFRLDRMVGPIEVGEPDAFVPPERATGVRFEAWRYGDDAPIATRVRIDASQANLSRSMFTGATSWTELDDGAAVVELEVTNRDAFRSLILGLLDHAVVLEPEEMRADVTDWLQSMCGAPA